MKQLQNIVSLLGQHNMVMMQSLLLKFGKHVN